MEHGEANWIYIVECQDNSYYVGTTNNVTRRLSDHIKGVGAVHIKHRGWSRLLQCWLLDDRSAAYRIEKYIKGLRKTAKEDIVANPEALELRIRKNLNWPIVIHIYETKIIEKMIVENYPELIEKFNFDQKN
ncbi:MULTISPECIES: GIY-YIG nuclease family protein [unclassified Paenibacillus]|uniref:GIY-YIG nuclease family protein n=1 Tax=unclassified Paenibacillus TaxID=185978 RepID=UPI00363EEB5C